MRSFKTSDGLTLAYSDNGTGTPVMCLAGLTRNSRDFDDLRLAMGQDLRLITMDYRGRGKSDYDPNYTNYSVPIEARDAIELLDFLELRRAVFVGTSRGGLISMFLGATAKDRIAAVLLNDIGPEIDPKGLEVIMGYLGKNPSYKTYAEAAAAFPEFYKDQFKAVPPVKWEACARRWFKETPDGLQIRYDPKLRDAILETSAQPAPDLWPLFDSLNGIPLALLRGENSDLLTRETVDEMARRRPDMTFSEVKDRGHVPFLDEGEAVGALRTLLLKVDL